MKTYTYLPIICLAALLALASCVNDPISHDTEVENGSKYSVFDFVNTFDCEVTLNLGHRNFVYLYTEDPTVNDHAEPVRSLWTDADGWYTCNLTLPTAMIGQQLYAAASGHVISATVGDHRAQFDAELSPLSRNALAADELVPDRQLCIDLRDAYLSKIPRYSYSTVSADNLKKLVETGEIAVTTKEDNSQVLFTYLHNFGWNSNYVYYYYYKGEDPVTLDNRQQWIDRICSDDRFLCTRGWGIGYTNLKGKPVLDDVEILTTTGLGGINLRFCNINCTEGGTGTINGSWTTDNNSMIGISNPLYFYGDISLDNPSCQYGLADQMPFPKGYKIGLILKSVHHSERSAINTPGYVAKNVNYYFSNPNLNLPDEYSGNQVHCGRFWSSNEASDISRFVYGFEDSMRTNNKNDGTDYNFTDFMCMISANPAAETADVASLSATYSAVSGTMLFEDNYPNQGDYDMNDVIVEYRKVKEFARSTSGDIDADYIKNMYVELTPVHYAAFYDDYLYVNCQNDDIKLLSRPKFIDYYAPFGFTLAEAARYNEDRIINHNGTGMKTVRFYFIENWHPYGHPDDELKLTDTDVSFDDIEIFIHVKTTDREVHMPFHTSLGIGRSNDDLADENLRQYRAKESEIGFFPWAMDVPVKSDEYGYRGFIPVSEGVNITLEYRYYIEWVTSLGRKSNIWYLNQNYTPYVGPKTN